VEQFDSRGGGGTRRSGERGVTRMTFRRTNQPRQGRSPAVYIIRRTPGPDRRFDLGNIPILDKGRSIRECRDVLRRLGHVLMIVAVLAANGTHWMVLQSIAWTTMLADNLQTSSLSQAIVRTFDGQHPCCFCKQIAKAKQSEKKSDFQVELKRLDFSYSNSELVFCPPSEFRELRAGNETGPLLTRAPAVPPPKALLA
jgi:hypothetical protein